MLAILYSVFLNIYKIRTRSHFSQSIIIYKNLYIYMHVLLFMYIYNYNGINNIICITKFVTFYRLFPGIEIYKIKFMGTHAIFNIYCWRIIINIQKYQLHFIHYYCKTVTIFYNSLQKTEKYMRIIIGNNFCIILCVHIISYLSRYYDVYFI